MWPARHTLSEISATIPREDLIRRSRILIIDDEKPNLIDDLQKQGFNVIYVPDITPENCHLIGPEEQDLIILDFGNVGRAWGVDEGLDLLRHIKHANPASFVIAYTSKALPATQADFYRLADATLSKDAGLRDSCQKIEDGLAKASDINQIWKQVLRGVGIVPGSMDDRRLQDYVVRSKKKSKPSEWLKGKAGTVVDSELAINVVSKVGWKIVQLAIGAALK
jgi:CheY-like chemotaxis protein